MPWHESRHVNKEKITSSRYVMTYSGMHIRFEVCCVWLVDRFKWMLSSEQLGIHANLLGLAEKMKSEEAKVAALMVIKNILESRLKEVEMELEGGQ